MGEWASSTVSVVRCDGGNVWRAGAREVLRGTGQDFITSRLSFSCYNVSSRYKRKSSSMTVHDAQSQCYELHKSKAPLLSMEN